MQAFVFFCEDEGDSGDTAMVEQSVQVVIGASGGIGSATARLLAKAGATLILAARDEDRVASLAGDLGAGHHAVDATDAGAVEELFDEVVRTHGRVDGALNAAGSLLLKPAHRTSPEEYSATVAANLTTAFNVTRSAARVMQKGGGSIVLMTSAVARVGMSNHEAVAAAKAGVIGLMLAASASYARRGIRVNCVAPGMTETAMTAKLLADDTSRSMSEKLHPMNTVAQPDEVARAITWLLDPAQRVVTGQTIGVDAGLGTVHPRN